MKKLLSLIGAISIIGSGASTVISCNDASNTNSADQQKANGIKDKITDTNITVSSKKVGSHYNTKWIGTLNDILGALQYTDQTLTKLDLGYITLSEATLVLNKPVSVAAIITVGTAKVTKDLKITLGTTDQDKVNAIKGKIIHVDLTVPAGTNHDTSNPATATAIKTSLKNANPSLTSDDLTKIKFNQATLQIATSIPLTATITIGHATATATLQVAIEPSLAGFLEQLQNKNFTKAALDFGVGSFQKNADGNYYSNNQHNIAVIQASIAQWLPSYKQYVPNVSFNKKAMVVGQTTPIEVLYKDQDQGFTIPITLTDW